MREGIRRSKWLLVSGAFLLSACGGLSNGPRPIIRLQDNSIVASDSALSNIRTAIATDCLNVTADNSVVDLKARRNRLVTAYMFGIDLAYNQYERNLLDAVRENGLGSAIASLALSSIGSVIGNQDLARGASTANAIVTGTHTAISRDYLLNQTLTVLQTQMRANRATLRALIIRRRSLEYSDWDSCMALSDVLAYEQAGTLNGAIAAISATAADANRNAELQAQAAIRSVFYASDRTAEALRAYLDPSGAAIVSRTAIAMSAMNDLGLGPQGNQTTGERLGEIVEDEGFEQQRRQLIEAIRDRVRQSDPIAARDLDAALQQ